MLLPALVVYLGVAALFMLTHRTIRVVTDEPLDKQMMAHAKLLGSMDILYTGDNHAMAKPLHARGWKIYASPDPDCSCTTYKQSISVYEVPVLMRIFPALFWPYGMLRRALVFILTDHQAL